MGDDIVDGIERKAHAKPAIGTLATGSYSIDIRPAHVHSAPIVYLNGFNDTGAKVWEQCRHLGCPDHTLVTISGLNWNDDPSPWPCDAIVSDSEPFAGKAPDYLKRLCDTIVPAAERTLDAPPVHRILAGYSLAGLFALWSSMQTDTFTQVASVSGSLWFPGLIDYAREHEDALNLDALYLSLGKKETRTPNRMMRHVQENTQQIQELARKHGIACTFEFNPGNHFSQPDWRCAKGIAWLLRHKPESNSAADQI